MDEGLILQLAEFLEDIGINTGKHIITRGNLMISCPFASVSDSHKSDFDSRPSMGIQFSKKGFVYNCFTCKIKGIGIIGFMDRLQEHGLIEMRDETTLLKFMRNSLPSYTDDLDKEVEKKERDTKIGHLIKINNQQNLDLIKTKNLTKHLNKLTVTITKDVKLLFDAKKKELNFPCYDKQGVLKGVVRRAKYNYINEVDVEDLLYLEWLIKGDVAIVTEGMFDAIIIYKYLHDFNLLNKFSSVSLFGAEFTKSQVKKLITYFNGIIIMGDNDDAGISLEKKLIKAIDGRIPTYKIEYTGSDPAEMKRSEFRKLIQRPMLFNSINIEQKKFLRHEW